MYVAYMTWRVISSPSIQGMAVSQPIAISTTSIVTSMQVNDDPDGEVNLPKAMYAVGVVALGTLQRARAA